MKMQRMIRFVTVALGSHVDPLSSLDTIHYLTEFTKHNNLVGQMKKEPCVPFSSSYEPSPSDGNNATAAFMLTFSAAAILSTQHFCLFLICLIFFFCSLQRILFLYSQQKTPGYMIH